MQHDEAGNDFTKQEVIDNLTSGTIRFVSMTSTGRRIRLLRTTWRLFMGRKTMWWSKAGKRFPVRYVYLDVVMKRDGQVADRGVAAGKNLVGDACPPRPAHKSTYR